MLTFFCFEGGLTGIGGGCDLAATGGGCDLVATGEGG